MHSLKNSHAGHALTVPGRRGFVYMFKSKTLFAACLAIMLSVPATGWSNTVEETPGPLAMTADTIFVRPVMFVTTILGAGVFLISSPFAALGGNIDESWNVLVEEPFETTFVRCLGCTMNGRKAAKVVENEN